MSKFVPEEGRLKGEMGFLDKEIRARFIRKVFIMVFTMLSIVALMSTVPFIHKPLIAYLLIYFIFLIVCFSLSCCKGLRRSYPSNLFLTAVLTISMGFMVSIICARHDMPAIVHNLAVTLVMCFGVIVFSCQTEYDFMRPITNRASKNELSFFKRLLELAFKLILFLISLSIIAFGLLAVLAAVAFGITTFYVIFSGLMAIVFMIYLAIDVQAIMGGRGYEIEPEDYILASTTLFLDIINIFLALLGMDN